jgi:hypothetical protein
LANDSPKLFVTCDLVFLCARLGIRNSTYLGTCPRSIRSPLFPSPSFSPPPPPFRDPGATTRHQATKQPKEKPPINPSASGLGRQTHCNPHVGIALLHGMQVGFSEAWHRTPQATTQARSLPPTRSVFFLQVKSSLVLLVVYSACILRSSLRIDYLIDPRKTFAPTGYHLVASPPIPSG